MSRKVRYRAVKVRDNIECGNILMESGQISFDSDAEIKRIASFTIDERGIDFLKDKLRAYMSLNGVESCLGTFVLSTPTKSDGIGQLTTVEAYDNTIILKEDCFTQQTYFAKGTRYDAVIGAILKSAGINDPVPLIMTTLPANREFELGTSKLVAINTLLDEINYNPILADEYGSMVITPYVEPSPQSVTKEYLEGESSLIDSVIPITADFYGVPNIFLATCDNPELEQVYYSKYINDNPASKLSTVARGRNIVSEVYQPDYITSQEALDEYVKRKAYEASLVYDIISIKTANVPGHGYRDIIRIKCGSIDGIYVEKSWGMVLSIGSLMSHTLVGVNPI